jgi:hypothetical protein
LIAAAKAAGHDPRVLKEIAGFNRRIRREATEQVEATDVATST